MDTPLLYGIAITALIVSDIILVVLGVVVYRLYRARRQENDQTSTLFEPLRQDIKGLSVSLSVLGERLGRLETQIGRLQERQEQQTQALPSNKEADHRAFQVATKMALQGADVEQIVNLCGLTRGEAELIRMLHAKHHASQEQPAPQHAKHHASQQQPAPQHAKHHASQQQPAPQRNPNSKIEDAYR